MQFLKSSRRQNPKFSWADSSVKWFRNSSLNRNVYIIWRGCVSQKTLLRTGTMVKIQKNCLNVWRQQKTCTRFVCHITPPFASCWLRSVNHCECHWTLERSIRCYIEEHRAAYLELDFRYSRTAALLVIGPSHLSPYSRSDFYLTYTASLLNQLLLYTERGILP